MGMLLPLLLPPLLFEEAGFYPHREGNGFPMHARKFCASFQRCSNLVNHTRDFPRLAVKIRNTHYRNSLPFAHQ